MLKCGKSRMASLVSCSGCQTECNAGVVSCYSMTSGAQTHAPELLCNDGFGSCMTTCAVHFLGEEIVETGASFGCMGPLIGR
mmetsp:Transcript_8661/g.15663  ORF Transcript_8661/g.15663 Transcript_8661/m.15663 type:complete len:82 (+) Transcript_8661:58-303(+)